MLNGFARLDLGETGGAKSDALIGISLSHTGGNWLALKKPRTGRVGNVVSATVPEELASGEYTTQFIIGYINGPSRRYEPGTDFPKLTIRIENPRRIEFSEIKSVTLKPSAVAASGGKDHQ